MIYPMRALNKYGFPTDSQKTTSKGYRQSEFEVKRRYRDFLWLYNTMHGNNPGVVVPPPPEKQALNRFESNFVESRRAALEKMCNKIAAHPTLQHDPDLKLFLESESFNIDVKHKERREPIPGESKGVFGSFGLNMGGGSKFVEQDDVSRADFHIKTKSNHNAVVPRPQGLSRRSRESAKGIDEVDGHHGAPA